MELHYTVGGEPHTLTVEGGGESGYTVTVGDRPLRVVPLGLTGNRVVLEVEGRRAVLYVAQSRDEIHVFHEGRSYILCRVDPSAEFGREGDHLHDAGTLIATPMPGRVVKVLVEEGDVVQPGQAVLIIESMKMENEVRALGPGRVVKVHVSEGDSMNHGDPAVELAPLEEEGE